MLPVIPLGRLFREADFALRQAFAFCPFSPEAVYKLAKLLASRGRFDDALLVVETSLKFDPNNEYTTLLLNQLTQLRGQTLEPPLPRN